MFVLEVIVQADVKIHSQFLYLAKKSNLTIRVFVYIKLGCWFIQNHRYAKLITYWRNTCILHDTGLGFCQATVSSIKRIVHMYILTGEMHLIYTKNATNGLYS